MKIFVIFGLLAVMATIVMCRNSNWGNRVRGDKQILKKTIVASPKFGKYQDRNLKYDPLIFRKLITAIYVQDNFKNASGAEVHLVNGGIGMKYATIRLHSQYSQGINSTVIIYGK